MVRLLNELLLTWSNRDSYGLPIGSNASRILGEAALIDIDNRLLAAGVDYVRFVDDFCIFARNAREAHFHLALLVHVLAENGLFLNAEKTRILDVADFHSSQEEDTEGKKDEKDIELKLWHVSVGGYGMRVPAVYRTATDEEIKTLDKRSANKRFAELSVRNLVEPDEVIDYIRVVAYHSLFDHFRHLPELAQRCPQLIPYIVDMLIKNAESLPLEIRDYLANELARMLLMDTFVPEYIQAELIRFLGSAEYLRKAALLRFLRTAPRNSVHVGRAAVEAVTGHLSRSEALEVRSYFDGATPWEKRAIIRAVAPALHAGELRPWLKNIRAYLLNDLMAHRYVSSLLDEVR